MGRQKKNELDAILEQLKQSYGTAQEDDLEDSLLETEESEEDAELASVLEKIFASSSDNSLLGSEKEELVDDEAGAIADEEHIADFESELSEIAIHESVSENFDHDIEVEEEIIAVADSENETSDVPFEAEESDEESDEELESPIAAEVEQFEGEYSLSDADRSFEEKIEEFLDEIEKADNSDEEERVDDVLRMMFYNASNLDVDRVDEDEVDENEENSVEETEVDDDAFDDEETEYISDEGSDDELTDEVIQLEINDFIEKLDEDIEVEDVAQCEEFYESEEEVCEDNEPETPAKILVLDPSGYTSDILQYSFEQMTLFKPEEDINYSIREETETEDEEQVSETEETVRSVPKTEINDNDVSLLLKFGYNSEIATSVGNEYAQTVVVEKNNEYIPPKHKIAHGFIDKEFSGIGQIDKITKKYKSDKSHLLILGIIISIVTLAMFACDVTASFAILSRDYTSMIIVELFLTLIIVACLWKKLYSGCLAIIRFDANLYSVLTIVISEYLIYCIAVCILFTVSPILAYSRIYVAFGGFVSLYASLTVWAEFLDCCRESNTFNIMSDGDLHYVLEKNVVEESEKSSRATYNVKKTGFVSGFFRRMFDRNVPNIRIVLIVGIIPVVAITVGVATAIIKDSIMMGFNSAGYVLFSAFPLSYALIPSIIEFIHSLRLNGSHSAFIGIPAVEEYARVDTLSFADEDAVEITALTEINPNKNNESSKKWINIASNVFEALGGPLSKTVHRTNAETSNIRHEATINSISENGIDLYFDSSMNVLIGDRHYMLAHNIKVRTDTNLSTAVKGVDKTVIYLAFDGVPKIGFIITSKVQLSFIETVELLEKNKIKVAVNSYEPEINDYYFENNKIDNSISVYKPATYERREPSSIADSGIIAKNPQDLCKTLIYGKKILNDRKIAKRTRVIQTVVGLVVAGLLVAISALSATTNFVEFLQENTLLFFYACTIFGLIPNVIHIAKLLWKK